LPPVTTSRLARAAPLASSPRVIDALRIFAAGSLRPAFDTLAAASPVPLALSYANARVLAERIAAGAGADVFASASAEHPELLHAEGLVDVPRPFATNRLVVAVPAASAARDAGVLAAPGARVVIEVAGIPLGDYTRLMLLRMRAGFAERVMANVVAEEQLVDDVAARLLAGDCDAGVLYATDVAARAPRLRAVEIPQAARVAVTLVACATASSADPARAAAWVAALAAPAAQAVLRGAGFGPVPRGQSA
jgi:molybdate transport system substrate-binding protein